MKGRKDPEYKKLRNKFLLGTLVAITIGAVLLVLIFRVFGLVGGIESDISTSNTYVVYLESDNCSNCSIIKEVLDRNNTVYTEVDAESRTAEDLYKKFDITSTEEINSGILYFVDGKMYSSLFNINNVEELEGFLEYYKLTN